MTPFVMATYLPLIRKTMTKIEEMLAEYYAELNQLLDKYSHVIVNRDSKSCKLKFGNSISLCEFTRKLNELGAPYQQYVAYSIEVFFTDDRYKEKPHEFKLVHFQELRSILIGPDGKCDCCTNDHCLNSHKMHKNRCTLEELKKLDSEASSRRAYQSGD